MQWQIANRGFDPAAHRRAPRLGSTELWQWHNPSNRVHPMHLHGMLFRVVERSSGVIHPGERGWKDTVGVLPGETVTVQPWFIPYAGRYVFHCHALEHGDKAMMLQLEVVNEAASSVSRFGVSALVAAARRRPPSKRGERHSTRCHGTPPDVYIPSGRQRPLDFAGTTQIHNVEVEARTRPWTASLRRSAPRPPRRTRSAPTATYTFFCAVHRGPMRGTVQVGTGARRPTAAAQPQTFANDAAAVFPAENGLALDTAKPSLKSFSRGAVRAAGRCRCASA